MIRSAFAGLACVAWMSGLAACDAAPTSSMPPPSESTGPSSQGPIPELLRGTWAKVKDSENTVTVAQCQIPPAPPGSVITITDNAIQYFETVATVELVTRSDAVSIEADFAEPSGDAVLTRAIQLHAQDEGRVLVTRDLTEDGVPEPLRYLRCPTRAPNT
ncbi:MAG: hypothetical protein ACTHWA_01500 [Arachnia sp.]